MTVGRERAYPAEGSRTAEPGFPFDTGMRMNAVSPTNDRRCVFPSPASFPGDSNTFGIFGDELLLVALSHGSLRLNCSNSLSLVVRGVGGSARASSGRSRLRSDIPAGNRWVAASDLIIALLIASAA